MEGNCIDQDVDRNTEVTNGNKNYYRNAIESFSLFKNELSSNSNRANTHAILYVVMNAKLQVPKRLSQHSVSLKMNAY